MHPIQRRSLFAILVIAESAIQQMKAILAQDPDGLDAPAARAKPQQSQTGNPEYLSESEEEAVERLLEEDRQRMVEEDARRMQDMWKGP